eukprot:357202-Chlamydomonas_euryale.AAC.6
MAQNLQDGHPYHCQRPQCLCWRAAVQDRYREQLASCSVQSLWHPVQRAGDRCDIGDDVPCDPGREQRLHCWNSVFRGAAG